MEKIAFALLLLLQTITTWLSSENQGQYYHFYAHAFVLPSPFLSSTTTHKIVQNRSSSVISLDAKSKKPKKKKSTASAGGGFGSATPKKKKAASSSSSSSTPVNSDYAVFPPLEPSVVATLVPSTEELRTESGELPGEIYDRLEQIYGFSHFNYELSADAPKPAEKEEESEDDDAFSFEDLLNSGSSTSSSGSLGSDLLGSSSSSSSSSKSSDLDFANLIASATGSDETRSSSREPEKTTTSINNNNNKKKPTIVSIPSLSNLPPFTDFRVLHVDPMIIAIDNFFTDAECDEYIALAKRPTSPDDDSTAIDSDTAASYMTKSKTVGKDAQSKSQRTSTTWFHTFAKVPMLLAKASRLLGLSGVDRWEEVQTVRYQKNEKFSWHLDALSPGVEDLAGMGGQRVATLLVYLTDMKEGEGGSTLFRDLGGDDGGPLKMVPKKGTACLFFPAAGGIPNVPFDIRTVHAGEVVSKNAKQDKWIAQMWLREHEGLYVPTAPPGNTHEGARDAIERYCRQE